LTIGASPRADAEPVELDSSRVTLTAFATSETSPVPSLDLEQSMNYVHDLFLLWGQVMVRAVVEEAATLTSLALFLGMIAIWAQVIAAL
jgi:hypothetical protein